MLSFLVIFFSSMVVAFSGAMMPGPLLTVTISESTRRGATAGPLLIAGHALLELLLVVGLLLGLGPLFENNLFFLIVAFLGGAIMLYMAWGMLKSIPSLTLQFDVTAEKKNNLLLSGILMSLANPYWIIWWATIGIGYILSAQKMGFGGVVVFYLGHILGDLIWYTAISFSIAKGRKLFNDKVYRLLIAVCGCFLIAFAFYLVVSAFGRL
jgi:threonine/homoserine/homoserine lactone efflux protein